MDGARPLKRNDAAVGGDCDRDRAGQHARRRAGLGYGDGKGAVLEHAYGIGAAVAAVGGGGYCNARRAARGERLRGALDGDRPVVRAVGVVHLDAAVAAVVVGYRDPAVGGDHGDAGRVDERGRGEKAGAVDLARQGAVGAEYAHGKIVGAEVVAHQGQDRAVGGGCDRARGQPVGVAFQCSREPAGVLVVDRQGRGRNGVRRLDLDCLAARQRAGRARHGQGQVGIAAVVRVCHGRVGIGQDERGGARVRQVGRHVALFYSVLEYEGARARPALVQRAAVPLARLQLHVRRVLVARRVRDVDGL